jgi:hypothetical protein
VQSVGAGARAGASEAAPAPRHGNAAGMKEPATPKQRKRGGATDSTVGAVTKGARKGRGRAAASSAGADKGTMKRSSPKRRRATANAASVEPVLARGHERYAETSERGAERAVKVQAKTTPVLRAEETDGRGAAEVIVPAEGSEPLSRVSSGKRERTTGVPQSSRATTQEVTPMKKRPYRAESVKQINVEAIAKAMEGRKLVVAVDVAKTKMRAALMNEHRENLGTVRWDHPVETGEFIGMLERLSMASIEVVMEPSGTYGHPLMHLCNAQWPVFLVSGKRTHDAAEVFDGVPSAHDGKCAQIIARLHLEGASRRWTPDSTERRDLKAATKTMDRYKSRYLEGVNEIEAELARAWPELTGLLELTGATLLDPSD